MSELQPSELPPSEVQPSQRQASELQPSELQPNQRPGYAKAESRIDEALQILREAQAPAGMEARLLTAVRAAEAAQGSALAGSAGAGLAWKSARVWGSMAAGIAVAVVAGGAFLGVRNHGVTPPVASRSGHAEVRQGSAPMAAPGTRKPVVLAPEGVKQVSTRRKTEPRLIHASSSKTSSGTGSAGSGRGPAKEASFYAPPAPLSKQELVLIALVRSKRLEDLAMLDPVARERETLRGDAEFEKFIQSRREEVNP